MKEEEKEKGHGVHDQKARARVSARTMAMGQENQDDCWE